MGGETSNQSLLCKVGVLVFVIVKDVPASDVGNPREYSCHRIGPRTRTHNRAREEENRDELGKSQRNSKIK